MATCPIVDQTKQDRTWSINELEFFTKSPGQAEWQKHKLVNATADFSEPSRLIKMQEEDRTGRFPGGWDGRIHHGKLTVVADSATPAA